MRLKLDAVLADLVSAQRRPFFRAALCAALVGGASVLLLGLSGWFLAAAAAAGLAGPVAALAFNYMLPAAAIRLLAIVRTGARYGERLFSHAAALHTAAALRERLFRAIVVAPAARALALTSGDASAHLAQDVGAIEGALVRRSAIWQAIAAAVVTVVLLLSAGWRPAAVLILVVTVALGLVAVLSRRLSERGRMAQEAAAACKQELAILLPATAEIRAYRLEAWALERIGQASGQLERHQRAVSAAQGGLDGLVLAAAATGAAAVFLLSAHAGAPIAALGTLGAVMAIDGLAPLARDWAAAGATVVADERLASLGGMRPPEPPRDQVREPHPDFAPLLFETSERLALRGCSGSGKTSLVEALLGLRPIEAGQVVVNGLDVALADTASLRALFAWCPQDGALIAGTIRDNLLIASPGADEDSLWAALEDAALRATVERTGGLDRWIGENGAHLSGGERRRLALARTYLRAAPCLLLDEPTEGLDAGTERMVVERLRHRLDRTGQGLVLVSHGALPLRLVDRYADIKPNATRPSLPGDIGVLASEEGLPLGGRPAHARNIRLQPITE